MRCRPLAVATCRSGCRSVRFGRSSEWHCLTRTRSSAGALPWARRPRRRERNDRSVSKLDWTDLDQRSVDTVRVLAMDAVQKVGNGHPGTAMSLAPAAYLLFQKVMRHNPADPDWAGPRPVRALVRPLQPHPLHPAVPRRLGSRARRPQVAAHLGQQDPGPPGVRLHRRRRDDHRPAGPGRRQRGRDGDGGASRARPARPGRRPGREPLRPPDLRHLQRRRPGGGRQLPRPPRSPATSSSATSR